MTLQQPLNLAVSGPPLAPKHQPHKLGCHAGLAGDQGQDSAMSSQPQEKVDLVLGGHREL
jgi:hypothetical protein